MLGMFHLLPLLKGWEYKIHIISRTVIRGESPIELSISEKGWLVVSTLLTNDCYATLKLTWQGADLQTRDTEFYAEAAAVIGAFAQDPAGWAQKYYRPNPNSSAGIYFMMVFSGGLQGSVWPYIPTVKMRVHLPLESTQLSAIVRAVVGVIAITDAPAFIGSLRRVLDAKASLKIDPALLVIGPAEFKEEEK